MTFSHRCWSPVILWLSLNGGAAQSTSSDHCARLNRHSGHTILENRTTDAQKDYLWGRADDLNECLNSLTISNIYALFTLHNLKYGVAESYAFTDIADGLNRSIESNTCGFKLHDLGDVDLKGFIDRQMRNFSDTLNTLSKEGQRQFLNMTIEAAPFHFAIQREFNRLNDAHTMYITPFEAFYYVLPIRFNSHMDGDEQVVTMKLVDYSLYYRPLHNTSIVHQDGDVVTKVDGKPVLQWMQDMVANDGPYAGIYQGMLQRLNNRFFVSEYVDRRALINPPPTKPLELTFADGSTETIHWLGRLSDYSKVAGPGKDAVSTHVYNMLTNTNLKFTKAIDFEMEFYSLRPETLWQASSAAVPSMGNTDIEFINAVLESTTRSPLEDKLRGEPSTRSITVTDWIKGHGYSFTLAGDAVVVSIPDFEPVKTLDTDEDVALALYAGFYEVQDYARQHGVTRLLFDVSSNGGGLIISSLALQWYVVESNEEICSPVVKHMTENWRKWVSSFGENYNQAIDDFFAKNPLLVGSGDFIQRKFQKLYDLIDHAKQYLDVALVKEDDLLRLRNIEDAILSQSSSTARADLFKDFLEGRQFLTSDIGQQLVPEYGWYLFDNTDIVDYSTGQNFTPPLSQYQQVQLRHWGKSSNYSKPGVFSFCSKVLNQMLEIVPDSYDRKYWSEVSFVTDGNCGSACSMFTQTLQLSGAATAFTFGSLADQPMDVSSFGGGNVLQYDDIAPMLNIASHLGNWATFGRSEWSQITRESWVNRPMPFPTAAQASYTWNIELAQQLGPNSLPRQFYRIPGHKHLNMWARNLRERVSVHETIADFKSWESLRANPQFKDFALVNVAVFVCFGML
ncbi:hypothetical protein FOL47_008324 [Perkinsus chesapeaki]|uniref:Tail specific protease domain-containing protein n=1 Tax=Perkinsus chesapeaki TaxID=330153 RepID=A0A7J6LEP3_PERCH|nr:hypothetical protein FOL47_008324 [Perkinsus chesapeaki]